jgi:uncharacterized protein YlxP (DUF503 family)
MAAHVLALTVDLRLPVAGSLKAKRSVVKSIVETCRRRYNVAAAESDHQDVWQRAELVFAAASGTPSHCEDVMDEVERYVWSVPDAEVLHARRHWLEIDR